MVERTEVEGDLVEERRNTGLRSSARQRRGRGWRRTRSSAAERARGGGCLLGQRRSWRRGKNDWRQRRTCEQPNMAGRADAGRGCPRELDGDRRDNLLGAALQAKLDVERAGASDLIRLTAMQAETRTSERSSSWRACALRSRG
jgi:hypothetical protein